MNWSFYAECHLSLTSLLDEGITYTILANGSKRCTPILLSSNDYTYGMKNVTKSGTSWRFNIISEKIDVPDNYTSLNLYQIFIN